MNTSELQSIIESIIETLGEEVHLNSGGRIFLRQTPKVQGLISHLRQDEEYSRFDGGLLRFGSTASSTSIENLANWLIDYSLMYGVEFAIASLDAFISRDSTPTLEIVLLQGFLVKQPFVLSGDISVVPVEQVPSVRFQKSYAANLHRIRAQSAPWGGEPWGDFFSTQVIPGAAIVRRFETPGALMEYESDAGFPPSLSDVDPNGDDIGEALCFLTVMGPCGTVPLAQWTEVEDWVPLKGYLGGFYQRHRIESYNFGVYEPTEHDISEAVRTYPLFRKLDKSLRQSLLVPLQRLNAAARRHSDVDRAIDLGIALEALLLSDREAKDSLALPFRLRGAYLLGGNDVNRRIEIERLFNCIYDLRSKAVHTGSISQFSKLAGEQRPTSDILNDGLRMCSSIIFEILELGRRPNWSRLILGGGA